MANKVETNVYSQFQGKRFFGATSSKLYDHQLRIRVHISKTFGNEGDKWAHHGAISLKRGEY